MVPQRLGIETVETSDAGGNVEGIERQLQNFTVTKKNGGGLFAVKGAKAQSKLVTISPSEFEKIIGSEGLLKTVNAKGKIEVTANDIDKIIEAVKQQIDSNQKIITTKDSTADKKNNIDAKPTNDETFARQTLTSEKISSSTLPTKLAYTTTTEPIVVNGRVLSPEAARNLMEFERTSTTTTTTPRPILLTTEEGFMNTFVFTGVHDMFKEALAERYKQGQGESNSESFQMRKTAFRSFIT